MELKIKQKIIKKKVGGDSGEKKESRGVWMPPWSEVGFGDEKRGLLNACVKSFWGSKGSEMGAKMVTKIVSKFSVDFGRHLGAKTGQKGDEKRPNGTQNGGQGAPKRRRKGK